MYTFAETDLLIDVVGYVPTTSTVGSVVPARVFESRTAPTVDGRFSDVGRVPAGSFVEVPLLGRGGVPGSDVAAVVMNVTAVEPSGWGFLTVYPCGSRPEASSLNYEAGSAAVANELIAKVSATGTVCVYTFAETDLLIDVVGYVAAPTTPPPTTTTTTQPPNTTAPPTTTLPPGGDLVVPDVVGLQQGDAMARINTSSLKPASGGAEHNPAPAGQVLRQSPAAGTGVSAGSEVAIVVSLGPELAVIPDVLGLTRAAATAAIEGAGFTLGDVGTGESDDYGIGEVYRQLPLGGQQALPGTPVDVALTAETVNDPPTIGTDPVTSHTTGTPYVYDVDATDPDGDVLTYSLQASTAAGQPTAVIDANSGAITWNPVAGDAGPHDFTVRVSDGRGGVDVQSFTVEVTVPNGPPHAVDDVLTATAGQPLPVPAATLLGNDTDSDADALAISSYTQPQSGRVTGSNANLTYVPNEPMSTTSVVTDAELTAIQPVVVTSDKTTNSVYPIARLNDGSTSADWFTTSTQRVPITLTFAFDTDVALRRVDVFGSRQFGEQGYEVQTLTIRALSAGGDELFTADLTTNPDSGAPDGADADTSFDLVPLHGGQPIAGVRTVKVVITRVGTRNYPGLSEIDLHGDAPIALLAPRLEWAELGIGAQTVPLVADLDRDGTPEVVYTALNGELRARSGAGGAAVWTRPGTGVGESGSYEYATPVVADFTDDPGLEVVHPTGNAAALRLVGPGGAVLDEHSPATTFAGSNLAAADVDGDGQPEVIGASTRIVVIDIDPQTATMSTRWSSPTGWGCGANVAYCTPVVVDIDLDGRLEIITGRRVIDAATGASQAIAPDSEDGFVGAANFDDDPEGEIVRVNDGNLTIFNHDYSVVWGPIQLATLPGLTNRGHGGPPTIADFDGDGHPEIGIAGAQVYAVYDPDTVLDADPATEDAVLWKSTIDDTSSSSTGSTVFDFDNDGRAEVVYADQEFIRVYDGPTGAVRWAAPNGSSTRAEAPVVADVDGDGEAEIVVTAERAITYLGTSYAPGIRVYGSPAGNWVRARAIWNQHQYDVTNVNADGTVPAIPDVNWLQSGMNNFRQQSFPLDETQRLDQFTYTVTDPDGATDTATVFVDVLPPENDPVITCGPPAAATVGFSLRGRICADDVDGDTLTYAADLTCVAHAAPRGNDNPWLAGMPAGTALAGDVAGPAATDESPLLVEFPCGLTPGETLTFEATGSASSAGAAQPASATDGTIATSVRGCNYDIAALSAPLDSLIGVFLSDAQPSLPPVAACSSGAPAGLSFATPAELGYALLAPGLQQPFFIGNGIAGDGSPQRIQVPEGATRLYLGPMDATAYSNNTGGFEVRITPATAVAGFTTDPGSGTFEWLPTTAGAYELDVVVTDATGRQARRSYPISVAVPAVVPGVVGTARSAAEQTITNAGLRVGTVTLVHDAAVAGIVIEQAPQGGAAAPPQSRVDLVVSTGPAPGDEDADGDTFSPNHGDCNDAAAAIHPGATEVAGDGIDSNCDGFDGVPPTLARLDLIPATPVIRVGESSDVSARAVFGDGTTADVTTLVAWTTQSPAVVGVDSRGRVSGVAVGSGTVRATYLGMQADLTVTVRAPGAADRTPPTIAITQPAGGSTVSGPTSVVGTADDLNFASYQLVLVDTAGLTVRELGHGSVPVVNGVLGSLDPSGLTDGVYVIRLRASDTADNAIRGDLLIRIGAPSGGAPVLDGILLNPVNPQLLEGADLPLTATAYFSDGSSAPVTDAGTWQVGAASVAAVSGTGVLTGINAGTTTVTVGFGGKSATRTVTVLPLAAPPDRTPPVASITAPAPGAEVTDRLDVTGTATDADLLRWTLELVNGDVVVAEVATSSDRVVAGRLGSLDPTLLINGSYELLLTVVDGTGNTSTARQPVTITGQLKVGTFALTFTDLVVPAAGLPLEVRRQYDTRDDQLGDFGYGWHLGLSNLRITSSGTQGQGWTVTTARFSYLLQPTRPHTVTVVLPDGTTEEFDATPSPSATAFAPPVVAVMGYTPRPGTRGRLEPTGNRNVLVVAGAGEDAELVDDTTFRAWDPQGFRYTTADGTRYTLNAEGVVQSILDPNGNTITIGRNGITHSSGASVVFERDALDRIIVIVDQAGNRQTYTYDAVGDLVAHTDAEGAVTRFRYTGLHDILEVIDPQGRPVERREYDDQGRLTAIISAGGERTTVTHDLAGRREVVTGSDGSQTVFTYDIDGNVLSVVDAFGGTTVNTYDADGNQLTTTDPLGRTTTRTFDSNGNELTVLDPAGDLVTRTYDARGRLLTEKDALGRTTTHTYDARGNRISTTDPSGAVETIAYDAAGNLVSVREPDGATTLYTYDGFGRQTGSTAPDGTTSRTEYDAAGNVIAVVGPDGARQEIEVDGRGNPTQITDALGVTTDLALDHQGAPLEVRRAGGAAIRQQVDAAGNPTVVDLPGGTHRAFTYTPSGQLATETDADGGVTTHTYDTLGRRIGTTWPDGSHTSTTYDLAGQVTSETDRNGGVTTYGYDAAGRRTSVTDPTGGTTQYAYDRAGNVIEEIDPVGGHTRFTYDSRNRLVRTTFADGTTEDRTYDAGGNLATTIDQGGHTTTYRYDVADNLIAVSDALGATSTATYDSAGNQTSITDANGHTTRYTYDATGRLVTTTFPTGVTETTAYNAQGLPATVTDRNGAVTTWTYDAMGRPLTRTGPDGQQALVYDGTGGLLRSTDAKGTITYTLDALDRVTGIANPDGTQLAYTYDAAGNRTSVTGTLANGTARTTEYAYDAAGRMVSVTDDAGSTTHYTYDAAGRQTTVTRPNGTVTAVTYDTMHRATRIRHSNVSGVLEQFDYQRNATGDPTTVTQSTGGGASYVYDAVRRLVGETHTDGTPIANRTYTYDPVSNRLSQTDALTGATTNYRYDADDRLQAAGSTTFTYDGRGAQLSVTTGGATALFGYDSRGLLTSASLPGGGIVNYDIDALGNRTGEGGVSLLVDPLAPGGVPEVLLEHAGGQLLASYTYGTDLVSVERGGTSTYAHTDEIGSIRLATDGTGAVVATADYSAFGETLHTTGTMPWTFGFGGQREDAGTGLYHLRARQYRPTTGAFTTVDPDTGTLDDPRSRHPYLYAEAAPLSYTDPTGRFSASVVEISVVASLAAGLSAAVFAPAGTGVLERAERAVLAAELAVLSTIAVMELTILLAGSVMAGVFVAAGSGVTGFFASWLVGLPTIVGVYVLLSAFFGVLSSCVGTALFEMKLCDLPSVVASNVAVSFLTLGLANQAEAAAADSVTKFLFDALPPFATDYLGGKIDEAF